MHGTGLSQQELAARLRSACAAVIEAREELTEIDSRFGDADHGITMEKIASAIRDAADADAADIHALLGNAADAVMMINGGSAVPLWYTWLAGLQAGAPSSSELQPEELKAMFSGALQEFAALSKAKVGDKTMLDALEPATTAMAACGGDAAELLNAAARAAAAGAEATRNFVAKFGRARSYGRQTLGTPDAGAVSMSRFFEGLAKN